MLPFINQMTPLLNLLAPTANIPGYGGGVGALLQLLGPLGMGGTGMHVSPLSLFTHPGVVPTAMLGKKLDWLNFL